MCNPKYSVVLLDADETIFDFLSAERCALLHTASSFGISASEDDAKVYSSINLSYWKKLELGEISREKLKIHRFESWFEYMGVSVDADKFALHYENKLSTLGILFDDAEDFVRKLSQYCDVYIVTNGLTKCQRGRMNESPIKSYIKGLFISEEVGYAKPDKKFFDNVFCKIGLKDKSSAVIIGDSLTSDMLGGRNAGIATCRYIRSGEYEHSDLCDYEITGYSQFFEILFN